GHVQRDQTTSRSIAYVTGRRDPFRLRDADGGDPQGQYAARGLGRIRRYGHALGQACRTDCAGLRQIGEHHKCREDKRLRSSASTTSVFASAILIALSISIERWASTFCTGPQVMTL